MPADFTTSIFDGTLVECWEALVTFQQFLILADAAGVVDMTPEALHSRTGIPLKIITKGIAKLEEPDPRSRTPTAEGRRIIRLEEHRAWGWKVTNFLLYAEAAREIRAGLIAEAREQQRAVTLERRRQLTRERTKAWRDRRSGGDAGVTQGERHGDALDHHSSLGSSPSLSLSKEKSARTVPAGAAAPELLDRRIDIGLPTNRLGSWRKPIEWFATVEQLEEWRELFPAVDVVDHLRRMRAWLLANGSRRKTAGGMAAFVVRWLSREQDRAARPVAPPKSARSAADQAYLENNRED